MESNETVSDDLRQRRVLTIQSHVVFGYVGNKASTFPLQVLGFDVDVINTVQFSNHTGYGVFKGPVTHGSDFRDIFQGLATNTLLDYEFLLTGYVGSLDSINSVKFLIENIKKTCPSAFYRTSTRTCIHRILLLVLDPVMGDNGHLYVPKEVTHVYRDELLKLADLITPNQFETELLVEHSIKAWQDVSAALDHFHRIGIKFVVITSLESMPGMNGDLVLVGSQLHSSPFIIRMKRLDGQFTGTGDLFASLLLAYFDQCGGREKDGGLQLACEMVISVMQKVLVRTSSFASKMRVKYPSESVVRLRELRLIQSKCDFESVSVDIHAQSFPSS